MIRNINFSINSIGSKSYDFRTRGIALFGEPTLKDTILYAIERCLASDFSAYFTEQDSKYGTEYLGDFMSANLSLLSGSYSYASSIVKSNLPPVVRCIRFAYGTSIRSFTSSKKGYSNAISDYTKYSSIDSSIWLHLVQDVNKILGCNAVNLVYTNSVLSDIEFDFLNLPAEVSKRDFELIYLILSEIYFSGEPTIVLLSDFNILSSRVLARFVDYVLKQEHVLSLVLSLPNNVKTVLSNSSITEITV